MSKMSCRMHYITSAHMDTVVDWACEQDTPFTRFVNHEFVMEDERTMLIREFDDNTALVYVLNEDDAEIAEYPIFSSEWDEIQELMSRVHNIEREYIICEIDSPIPTVMMYHGLFRDTCEWYNSNYEDGMRVQISMCVVEAENGQRLSETLQLQFVHESEYGEMRCLEVYCIQSKDSEDFRSFSRIACALGLELDGE